MTLSHNEQKLEAVLAFLLTRLLHAACAGEMPLPSKQPPLQGSWGALQIPPPALLTAIPTSELPKLISSSRFGSFKCRSAQLGPNYASSSSGDHTWICRNRRGQFIPCPSVVASLHTTPIQRAFWLISSAVLCAGICSFLFHLVMSLLFCWRIWSDN